MKKILLLSCTLISLLSFAQGDSSKIYNTKNLKKGFYKSYNEYINNSPSITSDFIVKPKTVRKSDSAVICVDFEVTDGGDKVGSIWGFCDGKDVYIKFLTGLNNNKYWRAEHIGRYPYFYYFESSFGFGPGIIRIATFLAAQLADKNLILAVKDEKNRDYNVNERNVRKLLVDKGDLLQQFEKDIEVAKNTKPASEETQKRAEVYKKYLSLLDQSTQ